ncbi:MAG: vWA domain-containing protein [Acidobacteriota bacterium]
MRPIPQTSAALPRLALALVLTLALASVALAAPQDIDLSPGCPNSGIPYPIDLQAGVVASLEIGALSADGPVTWSFDSSPNCNGVAGGPSTFTCGSGLTIALPDEPGDSVAGTPTVGETFQFALEADDGSEICTRQYEVNVTAPFDLTFVLDRSGSMGGTTHVSPPAVTRWDALELGMDGFVPLLVNTAPTGSNLSVNLFASSEVPTGNAALNSPIPASTPNLANDIAAELAGQSPSGSTAMGTGLKAGIADLPTPGRPRVVVLFTDGEQNREPQVNGNGQGFSDGTSINPVYPAPPGSIKVITVGVGAPSASYLSTLQELAVQNRGYAIITSNGTGFTWSDGSALGDIGQAFDNAIAPALQGNSPVLVATHQGELTSTPVGLPAFDLNDRVDKLLLQLSFDRRFETPSLAQLLSGVRITQTTTSGTQDVTQLFRPVITGNFGNSILLVNDFNPPQIGPVTAAGSYTVELAKPTAIDGDLSYRLLAFADDHRLDVTWRAEPAAPRVDRPFRPTVELRWLNAPIEGADVEAWILRPGDDLGDLLAKHPLVVDAVGGEGAPDAGSPGHQKYLELLNDPDFLAQLTPEEQRPTLTHRGGGVYAADFDPGDVSGVYQVLYRIRAEDPAFGRIQRLAMQSVYVRFGEVDLGSSDVTTTVKGQTTTLSLRPKTDNGRLVGPANGGTFSIDGGGLQVGPIVDLQDGRYTVTLTGDPETEIGVDLLGEEIYRGPAADFGPPKGSTGSGLPDLPWWLWVVIVLVILVVWWLRR